MVIADGDEGRVDPMLAIEERRRAERRLVEESASWFVAQAVQRLLRCQPARVQFSRTGGDDDPAAEQILDDLAFPRVAALQDRLDQWAVIKLRLGNALL